MRILIAEDDFTSRRLLQKMLAPYGDCDIAINGNEAVQAYRSAWSQEESYDLICLDILMPTLNGIEVLQTIRQEEEERGIGGFDGVKIIMTTALDDAKNIFSAFRHGCEAYIMKPIDRNLFLGKVRELGLIESIA